MRTIIFIAVFCVFTLEIYANHLSAGSEVTANGKKECKDRYIWIADGSWACSSLAKKTRLGVHKNPKKWCKYILTLCCKTCNALKMAGKI